MNNFAHFYLLIFYYPSEDSSFIVGLQSPDIFRSPATAAGSLHDESYWDFAEPLAPEICLEHAWEETMASRLFTGEASKAFLTTDICGEDYICYLIPSNSKLR